MKIFTYQNYLKMIETSGKIAIKIIDCHEYYKY